jgi:hypothetical protein
MSLIYCVTALGAFNRLYTDTVHTSQETHYISATGPNRLMLSGESLVYCENHTEHTDTARTSQEKHCLRCRAQSVNAVWRNSRCLL